MVVIRPISSEDLGQLVELANQTSFGLTTLPKDEQLLRQRIEESEKSFEKIPGRPGGESYLLVLEDLTNGAIAGTCGVVSKVGGFEPFYAYRIETSVHESPMLKVRKEIQTLHLVREHNGPSEICSLYLAPDYRSGTNGRLLSLCRFLFMAGHRDAFAPQVIAEMRGVVDSVGHSPFWESLGRHFFEIEYPTADYLCMVNKKFIADLMPTYPIFIPLLPTDAQAVIGKVHKNTKPALQILEREGFEFTGMVDIFEAGPVIGCELENVRAVRESKTVVVKQINDDISPDNEPQVLSNTQEDFRACCAPVQESMEGGVAIDNVTSLALGVRLGDTIRYVALRPAESDVKDDK